jgi:hypothetical protein
VSGVAFGNGMFAAIGGKSCTNVQGVCTASTVLRSDATGQTWTEAGTVPEPLADLAYGNGTWTAVGTASGPAGQTPLEYQSTDLTTWKKVTPTVTDRGSGTADGGFVTIAFADGHWAGTIFYGETALGAHSQLVTSTDGVHWDSPALANSQDTAAWARGFAGVAHGDKGWLAIGQNSDWDGNGPISAAKQTGVVISSSDGTSWTSSATTPADVSAIAPVFSGGSWYAISAPLTSAPTTSVDLLSSADGKAWTRAGTITIPAGAKSGSTVGPAVTDLAAAA